MFSALTQPNFPKAALGLRRESVTAVALQRAGKKQYEIRQAANVELSNGLLTPDFLGKNIHNLEELRVLLDEVVFQAGLGKQKNWSVSLPSETARSAILTLDAEPASSGELSEVLDWKSEQVFGAPAGELRISRQKIAADRDGKARYFATAVKLAVIDEYENLFETQGWRAGLILPRAVSESNWLNGIGKNDSLLISLQDDGFTALLIRGGEPTIVRSVTCTENERDDEIFRLLMFYRDRLAIVGDGILEDLLIVGKEFIPEKIDEISADALGEPLRILQPQDVGLHLPDSNLTFDDLAAPAGLAALGWN